jgi:hypothetical protein
MKRKVLGLLVVALAVSLSAYTSRPENGKASYYWFPLSATGSPQPVNTLVFQQSDPYNCANWAPGSYCAGGYTSYTFVGSSYYAAGTEVLVHYSFFF